MLRLQEPNTVNGRRPRQDRDPLIGTRLDDRYLIEERLATGGFGAVYRATTSDGQRVALKILHPWLTSDETMVARFRREGATLTQLHDPHTVTTLAVGETADGTLYIAMELLTGESLHDRLRRAGALPWQTAVAIARAVCSSLAEAHALGVVHRDLKPANIQIEARDDGSELVKVIDFGIVKIARGSAIDDGRDLTYAGHMIGTFDYMSPEQILGETCSDVSDIYSLGLVTYEMITGRRAFPDVTGPASMMAALLTQTPAPPSIHAAIPPELDQIVMRCLAREPEDRFGDIGALAAALDRALAPSDGREAITAVTPAIEPDPMMTLVEGHRAWVDPAAAAAADEGLTTRDDRATCERPWAMPRIELPEDLAETRAEPIDSGPLRSKDRNLLTARVPLVGAATLAAAPIIPAPDEPNTPAAPVARSSGLAHPAAMLASRRTPSAPIMAAPAEPIARGSGLVDPAAVLAARRAPSTPSIPSTPSTPFTTLPGIAVAALRPRRGTPTPDGGFPAQALCATCTQQGLCEQCLARALRAARSPSAPRVAMVAPIGWQPVPSVRAWIPEPAIPLGAPGEPLASGSEPQPQPQPRSQLQSSTRSYRVLWLGLVLVLAGIAAVVLAATL